MSPRKRAVENSEAGVEELRLRLEEAESTLRAIREGTVDAFLVEKDGVHRVYTLTSADRPYRMLVESMQQGACTVLEDLTVLYANERALEMLGDPRLIGKRMHWMMSPGDQAELERVIAETDGQSGQGELCIRIEGRPEMPVHVTASVLPVDGPPSYSVILTDLTAQKHSESLERRQAALEEADRRKDEFLGTLAHELRNPLAPLRTGLKVMELATRDTDAFDQARDIMRRQLSQMVRLVDGLMDISRITLGKIELNRQPADLGDIVRQAVGAVRADFEESGQDFIVKVPSEPIPVKADAARLQQVFTNILDNAHRYTPRGGRIELEAATKDGHVTVRVTDTGIGIAPAQLPRVFELFAQVERGGDGPPDGLGVGLSIAQRLVRMHGGSIEASSKGENRGTEIVVRLPLLDGQPVVTGEHAARSWPPGARRVAGHGGARRRVLIADDNVAATKSLSLMLTMSGHEVKTAFDGHEAYDMAEWYRPDVALLDIGMPKVNGLQLCSRIRSQPWGKKMLIIAVTAWGQPSHRHATAEAGFDHHLVKPVDPAELLSLINQTRAQRL